MKKKKKKLDKIFKSNNENSYCILEELVNFY